MEDLHEAIADYLRTNRVITPAEREAQVLAIWRDRQEPPRCCVCGLPVDHDGGLFSLPDMQLRRQCVEHYCPF